MNATGDRDDGLAAGNQRRGFAISKLGIDRRAESPRVSKLTLNILEFIETLEILRRTDGGANKRRAHSRLADLFEFYPIAGGGEFLKVLNDFGPARQLAIVAGTKAEQSLRRRDRSAFGDRDGVMINRIWLNWEGDEENCSKGQRQ